MAKDVNAEDLADQIAELVSERLAPMVAGRLGLDYHCTGSRFGCGEYSCISAVHSCKGDFDCHGKFSNSYLRPDVTSIRS